MQPTIAQVLAAARLDAVDARALLRHACGVDDAYLIAHANDTLSAAQNVEFAALVARRVAGEPVAYITGAREFFSLEFKVTPAVLIPRPETELLVEFALECIDSKDACSVLDLGTGSGCVAIAIAHARPQVRVVAVDSSAAALDVARANPRRLVRASSISTHTLALPPQGGGNPDGCAETPSPLMGEGWDAERSNALRHSHPPLSMGIPGRGQGEGWGGDGDNLSFVQSDWFSALNGTRYNVIVANPPYVAAGDAHLLQGDLRFEPAEALVAGGDGLDSIRVIVASAARHLIDGGWLAFEHGYDQAARCRELLAYAGFSDVFTRTDIAGIERMSGGRWR
jgi:release factor glutamine methyltransferase